MKKQIKIKDVASKKSLKKIVETHLLKGGEGEIIVIEDITIH